MPGPHLMMSLVSSAAALVALFGAFWAWSVVRRDVGVTDIAWGLGFVLVATVAVFEGDARGPRRLLVPLLVGLWGARLASFLAWRNLVARLHAGGEMDLSEDRRYGLLRRKHGPRFWWVSLFSVFGLQASLVWIISLPVVVMQAVPGPTQLGFTDYLGVLIFGLGLAFETVGDAQLFSFRMNPGSHGQVLTTGLWRYSRHPNYFGDALAWWGIFVVCAGSGLGVGATALSPLLLTILLVKVSGVARTERNIAKRRPLYRTYLLTTSAFIPWLPRKPQDQSRAAGVHTQVPAG